MADGWLAAHASAVDAVLATHESRAPAARKKVPLPDLCDEFDVAVCDIFEMLRDLAVRLDWARP